MSLFEDFISGFVWVEGRKVVGNVTLQCADQTGSRWRISNVAVAPSFRGRGIAGQLMLAAIRDVAERGGSWIILQVRIDNPTAYGLYQQLGFTDVCREGIWRLPAQPLPATDLHPEANLQRLRPTEWRARLELARASRPELATWLSAIHEMDYRVDWSDWLVEALGRTVGLQDVERWGAMQDRELLGFVESRASSAGQTHRLRFDVRPSARGSLEAALIAQGLRSLAAAPQRPVLVDHSGDHSEGVAALEAAGFRPQRVLLTMRRAVTAVDRRIVV
jgi:hypothetical protein